MATVIVSCPSCGKQLNLQPTELVLHSQHKLYSFWCSGCNATITKPTDRRIANLLLAAGVQEDSYPELIDDPDAPPFTEDDLIDFHFELERLGASDG